jgi:hypothetical protein
MPLLSPNTTTRVQISSLKTASQGVNAYDILATVKPDDKFWLNKRVPGTHNMEVSLFPRDQAVAVLRAMATAQPWEPYGMFGSMGRHIVPRQLKAMLVWSKDMTDRDRVGLGGNVLWIHSGNGLISYGSKIYVVPAEAREILDRMFPDSSNSSGDARGNKGEGRR